MAHFRYRDTFVYWYLVAPSVLVLLKTRGIKCTERRSYSTGVCFKKLIVIDSSSMEISDCFHAYIFKTVFRVCVPSTHMGRSHWPVVCRFLHIVRGKQCGRYSILKKVCPHGNWAAHEKLMSNVDVVFLFQGISLEKHMVVCACQGTVGGRMLKKRRRILERKTLEWVSRHYVTWHV